MSHKTVCMITSEERFIRYALKLTHDESISLQKNTNFLHNSVSDYTKGTSEVYFSFIEDLMLHIDVQPFKEGVQILRKSPSKIKQCEPQTIQN